MDLETLLACSELAFNCSVHSLPFRSIVRIINSFISPSRFIIKNGTTQARTPGGEGGAGNAGEQ
uniref:Uncharacterized protein MANES_S022900 n=1 Tax=Rhizophora mucronata TaxID=61149 RepID=A0A2P2MR90_RHIMU